jgi:hypothetical protein
MKPQDLCSWEKEGKWISWVFEPLQRLKIMRLPITIAEKATKGLGVAYQDWSWQNREELATCSSSLCYSLRRVILLARRAWQETKKCGSVACFCDTHKQPLILTVLPVTHGGFPHTCNTRTIGVRLRVLKLILEREENQEPEPYLFVRNWVDDK